MYVRLLLKALMGSKVHLASRSACMLAHLSPHMPACIHGPQYINLQMGSYRADKSSKRSFVQDQVQKQRQASQIRAGGIQARFNNLRPLQKKNIPRAPLRTAQEFPETSNNYTSVDPKYSMKGLNEWFQCRKYVVSTPKP